MAFPYLTTFFVVLFLGELYFVPYLLSLDVWTQQWIHGQRSCSLDAVAVALQDWTRPLFLPPLVVTLVTGILIYKRRWQDIARFFIIIGGGGLAYELTKFLVIRPRPSVLPFVLDGNSFPSGHVVNGLLLLAGAYCALAWQSRRKTWTLLAGVLIGLVTLIVALQRLYLGRHWTTDVLGGLLLGLAWTSFVTARWRKEVTVSSCVGLAVFFSAAFLLLWLVPILRIRLPSPLTVRSQPVARVEFGSDASHNFKTGQWSAAWEELGNPIRTMIRRESSVYVRLPAKSDYTLSLGIRPKIDSKTSSCTHLKIFLNDQPLNTIHLYEGWRDYNVPAPKEFVVAGSNEVTFRLSAEAPLPGIFMYLEAFPQDASVANLRAQPQPASSVMQ